jgi:glycerate kinase
MKLLIASDSHKDFASSKLVCNWIGEGLLKILPDCDINLLPVSDGGEGLIESLVESKKGYTKSCQVHDALFRPISTNIGFYDDHKKTAVIEIAQASGSAILLPHERNTMIATSYGTGELIRFALNRDCKKVIIGLGGSIVSDGGMGMAQALGAVFFDKEGSQLYPIKNNGFNVLSLPHINKIDISKMDKRIKSCEFLIAADVNIPLLGPNGQAQTFGPQKGATAEEIAFIEHGLSKWNDSLQKTFGRNFNIANSGAAGGMGSGLMAFLSGQLELGIELFMRESDLMQQILQSDVVVTGEGKLDSTSVLGKASTFIAGKARTARKRVLGIFGIVADSGRDLCKLFDRIIESNKAGVDVLDPDFKTEIGPAQIRQAGAELAVLLKP